METFPALMVQQKDGGIFTEIRQLALVDLPPGDLLIKVAYSGVNYKDALACISRGNVVKTYPFVPGIDLAGVVVTSGSPRFREGDEVVVTGYELGVTHFGGLSGYARIPSEWAVKLPKGLDLREAMIFGTAGFTAGLSVQELQDSGIHAGKGPVLVTGATGGVGSLAVAILSMLGYDVVASTGKAEMKDYLHDLGAARIIPREELIPVEARPLDKQTWAGAVDSVGGSTLSAILSRLQSDGAVAATGLTGGAELHSTVFPFILRGVRLIGINSVYVPQDKREHIWARLASDCKPSQLERICREISLEEVPAVVPTILSGGSRGRVVVKL